MRKLARASLVIAGLLCVAADARVAKGAANGPFVHTYRVVDGDSLHAYAFYPSDTGRGRPTQAILLFHGGGWSTGSPEWTFAAAERFAGYGLVAIAVEYRLSEGDVTPIEALDDACHAFAWARGQARELGIADRIAGYGVSAGGHLAAATATVGCGDVAAHADALLLWSPALDVKADGWFTKLLQGRGKAVDYSPADHVRKSTPPTCIVHGALDSLTPLAGVRRFHDRLLELGGACELNVYPGLGHLLTRNLSNQEGDYDPDPEKRADGIEKQRQFLVRLGFVAEQ